MKGHLKKILQPSISTNVLPTRMAKLVFGEREHGARECTISAVHCCADMGVCVCTDSAERVCAGMW